MIIVVKNGIARIQGDEVHITDAQSALDLIATVRHETGCDRVAIPKSAIREDFFMLSTGIAGEILQKFATYQVKLAIIGDYSKYTSKPLRDFIYESNKGNDVFFVATEDEAVAKLAGTPMVHYTASELDDAKGAVQSSIRKIEKVVETLSKKDPPPKAQLTLARRNLRALRLSVSLIEREMSKNAD